MQPIVGQCFQNNAKRSHNWTDCGADCDTDAACLAKSQTEKSAELPSLKKGPSFEFEPFKISFPESASLISLLIYLIKKEKPIKGLQKKSRAQVAHSSRRA